MLRLKWANELPKWQQPHKFKDSKVPCCCNIAGNTLCKFCETCSSATYHTDSIPIEAEVNIYNLEEEI